MAEYPLRGGSVNTVVRAGDTVRRRPGGRFVHELLGFFERSGWGGAPRFLGVDEQGREILSFVEGYVPWQEPGVPGETAEPVMAEPVMTGTVMAETVMAEASLARVAELVREFHDLTAGTPLAGDAQVVCHNDLAPNNTVYSPGGSGLCPVAFIDWDLVRWPRTFAGSADKPRYCSHTRSCEEVEWRGGVMAEPVRARRLTDQEGQRLLQIVRRGKHGSVRVRRAMIIMASASGTLVPAIARLVAADEDTVRDVIHLFNQEGLAALDPQWAGGRPRLISDQDVEVIVAAAATRPEKPVQPFTRWSLRKLAACLGSCPRPVAIGRERLRQILHARGISFQRTRTWKESRDPDRDAKLDRIEYVTSACPDRCFAFDQFGPLSIRPCHGACWAKRKHPGRLRATYHRTHGIRYFHGCYSIGDDQLWGVTREHKGAGHTLTALKSIRAARPGGYRLFVILDNLAANKTPAIRRWAKRENVELCLTPTNASWANPIEAHFGPLRTFVMGGSDHPNHPALARRLQAYLRWRNAHARHPDVLAAQRRERARIRSERQQRRGRPKPKAA